MRLHPDTLPFLDELSENNNRDWFNDNKKRWESIRECFVNFTQGLIDFMEPLDPSLGNLNASKCIYRIYRDIRFSPDKRPYKTHISCFLPTGGNRRCAVPGYYVQFGQADYGLPAGGTLGGGIFMPEPKTLEAIRQEIYYNTDEFLDIIGQPDYQHYFGNTFFTSKVLSRVPKGYPSDWPYAHLLKYKDYTSCHQIPDRLLPSGNEDGDKLFNHVCDALKASVPLNLFIQRAME